MVKQFVDADWSKGIVWLKLGPTLPRARVLHRPNPLESDFAIHEDGWAQAQVSYVLDVKEKVDFLNQVNAES